MFQDAKDGDFTGIIKKVLTPKMDIQAPVFFSNTPGVIQSSGVAWYPAAVLCPFLKVLNYI